MIKSIYERHTNLFQYSFQNQPFIAAGLMITITREELMHSLSTTSPLLKDEVPYVPVGCTLDQSGPSVAATKQHQPCDLVVVWGPTRTPHAGRFDRHIYARHCAVVLLLIDHRAHLLVKPRYHIPHTHPAIRRGAVDDGVQPKFRNPDCHGAHTG